MDSVNHTLASAGIILFLIGLLNGFAIPLGRSPRLSLSAHTTAVQSGTFLIALGIFWPFIEAPGGWGTIISHVLWISLHVLWLALFLSGVLGAGRSLPLAGGGVETKPLIQAAVSTTLHAGTLGTTLAVAIVAYWTIR